MRETLRGVLAIGCAFILVSSVIARAEVAGPVVGFVRVQIAPGPQLVTPTVVPRQPAPDETAGRVLAEYLGQDFRAGTNADTSDWVGCTSDQSDDVVLLWRDEQGQWRDLLGNPIDAECSGRPGFWFDLVFDSSTMQTRELVLSGEITWLGEQ